MTPSLVTAVETPVKHFARVHQEVNHRCPLGLLISNPWFLKQCWGRDLRSISGVYLLFRFLLLIANVNIGNKPGWLLRSLMFLSLSIFMLIVQPYKKSYVNVLDGLLLALLGLVTLPLVTFQYLHNIITDGNGALALILLIICSLPQLISVECHLWTNERKQSSAIYCKASTLEFSHISMHSHHTKSNIMLW